MHLTRPRPTPDIADTGVVNRDNHHFVACGSIRRPNAPIVSRTFKTLNQLPPPANSRTSETVRPRNQSFFQNPDFMGPPEFFYCDLRFYAPIPPNPTLFMSASNFTHKPCLLKNRQRCTNQLKFRCRICSPSAFHLPSVFPLFLQVRHRKPFWFPRLWRAAPRYAHPGR